ncbi:hypothetical protein BpHYR1_008368 [Brachionus plicatilis]|uniref:Uncharacterized protein n=1 Tax=Brachionus plicatilis TaxID=10195 RepID=A0A3M7S863_BRAPC|nr:hypothetical protein BpHYR1_008368 [Brachionus plicatilis]
MSSLLFLGVIILPMFYECNGQMPLDMGLVGRRTLMFPSFANLANSRISEMERMADTIRQISMQKAAENVQDQKRMIQNYVNMIDQNRFNKKVLMRYNNQTIRYNGREFINMLTRKPLSNDEQKQLMNLLKEKFQRSAQYLDKVEKNLRRSR